MSQVSRRVLSKNVEEKIFSIFFKSLARLSDSKDIEKFLLSLLGPVEQTMLAKRLAIAILLAKGYRYETIKSILKVSQETIARVNISLNYQGEGYEIVVKKVLRDEKIENLLEKAGNIGLSILPNSSLKRTLETTKRKEKVRKSKTSLG